ncbi:hypothetical protein R1sor_008952 [Riccia sorocarpa]|uniref:Uncharacterized protein n=1 Tax=Riccia sorocarpa TaxID=122646 RepID=A0ABD3H509_9MARC
MLLMLETLFESVAEQFQAVVATPEALHEFVVTTVSKEVGGVKTALKEFRAEFEDLKQCMEAQSLQSLQERLKDQIAVTTSVPGPGLDFERVMEQLDTKIKTYADVTRVTQAELLQEQEAERKARAARSLNLRIVGLEEEEGEDDMDTVTTLCRDVLHVLTPQMERAVRVGRSDRGPRPILIRFSSMEDLSVVLANRHMLKGRKIWVDSDLTPAQAEDRKKELVKVKTAQEAGFIAYMRNDRAVVTNRRREES